MVAQIYRRVKQRPKFALGRLKRRTQYSALTSNLCCPKQVLCWWRSKPPSLAASQMYLVPSLVLVRCQEKPVRAVAVVVGPSSQDDFYGVPKRR